MAKQEPDREESETLMATETDRADSQWDYRIPQTSVCPDYELRIYPLTRHPNLVSIVEQAITLTLEPMIHKPLCMHAATLAAAEMVGNILSHADWGHETPPSFRAWINPRPAVPELNLQTKNAVKEPEVVYTIQKTARLCNDATEAMRAIAQRLFDMGSESVLETNAGIGLLQVAASGRCRIVADIDPDDTKMLVVRVSVPLREGGTLDASSLYARG